MTEIRIEEYSPLLGKVNLNFTGDACLLYRKLLELGEISRQKEIDHLGLLSHSYSNLNHSRYDYFITQSVLSELLENQFKGTTSAQGNIKVGGENYRGNDLLKIWFLLSNYGHCKYTIGDEKALMIFASKRRGFFSALTKPYRDDALIKWAKKTIKHFDYIKFHHIITLFKIYKTFKRDRATQDRFVNIYKLLLLPIKDIDYVSDQLKLEQLKIIYKNIRKLAIIALDTSNSHLPITIDVLSTILSFDFNFDKFQGRKLSRLFDPLTNLLYSELYLSREAQTLQRDYEIKALKVMNELNYNDIIERALGYGLASLNDLSLTHFVRKNYTLNAGQSIKDHFNIMQQIKRHSENFESSIDFNLLTREAVIDVYYRKDSFDKKELPLLITETIRLSSVIDEKQLNQEISAIQPISEKRKIEFDPEIETIGSDQISAILKSFFSKEKTKKIHTSNHKFIRNIIWSVLRFFLKKKYYFDLDIGKEKRSFGVIYPDGQDYLSEVLLEEKKHLSKDDVDRLRELEHLEYATKRKFSGYVIACLDRIKIYDYSLAPNKRIVTDIDSLVVKANSNEFVIEFNETKNMSNPGSHASRDLRSKFIRVLNKNAQGYRINKVPNYGAKLRIRILR